jgi:hypothetical protein
LARAGIDNRFAATGFVADPDLPVARRVDKSVGVVAGRCPVHLAADRLVERDELVLPVAVANIRCNAGTTRTPWMSARPSVTRRTRRVVVSISSSRLEPSWARNSACAGA